MQRRRRNPIGENDPSNTSLAALRAKLGKFTAGVPAYENNEDLARAVLMAQTVTSSAKRLVLTGRGATLRITPRTVSLQTTGEASRFVDWLYNDAEDPPSIAGNPEMIQLFSRIQDALAFGEPRA